MQDFSGMAEAFGNPYEARGQGIQNLSCLSELGVTAVVRLRNPLLSLVVKAGSAWGRRLCPAFHPCLCFARFSSAIACSLDLCSASASAIRTRLLLRGSIIARPAKIPSTLSRAPCAPNQSSSETRHDKSAQHERPRRQHAWSPSPHARAPNCPPPRRPCSARARTPLLTHSPTREFQNNPTPCHIARLSREIVSRQ